MNCEKITYYIDKGLLTELNISEKIQVKLHTMICRCCKNYTPDTAALDRIMALLNREDEKNSSLTKGEKDELKSALENLKL